MKIKCLEIENFRGFNGKHEINFSVDDDKPVTLTTNRIRICYNN